MRRPFCNWAVSGSSTAWLCEYRFIMAHRDGLTIWGSWLLGVEKLGKFLTILHTKVKKEIPFLLLRAEGQV